jgi:hypothetical protein
VPAVVQAVPTVALPLPQVLPALEPVATPQATDTARNTTKGDDMSQSATTSEMGYVPDAHPVHSGSEQRSFHFSPEGETPVSSLDVDEGLRHYCEVCGKFHLMHGIPQLDGCTQEPKICRACFEGWLEAEVGDTTLLSHLQCPCIDPKCKARFDYETVRRYVARETFDR